MRFPALKKVRTALYLFFIAVTCAPGAQITPAGVMVWPNARASNDTPPNAIDGNTNTYTWSTESFTTSEASIGLDFGSLYSLDRIRLWKLPDGGDGPNIKNLIIEVTSTSSGSSLDLRTWTAVSGLTNGYLGTELLSATSVNADGTVIGDVHNSTANGWASLTFDLVNATGVRIRFTVPTSWNHYRVGEFQAYGGDAVVTPEPGTAVLLLSALLPALAFVRRRH